MNHSITQQSVRYLPRRERAPEQPGEAEIQQLREIYWALRRHAGLIFVVAAICSVLTYVASLSMEDRYSSVTQIMLETRVAVDPEYTPQVSGLPTTLTSLQSEVEVLRSSDLLVAVIGKLNLLDHPEFNREPGLSLSPIALLRQLKSAIEARLSDEEAAPEPLDPAQAELRRLDEVIEQLRSARQIEQIGETSAVYRIRVTTGSPVLSANIANALAGSYLEAQRRMKLDTLNKSQGWLTARTVEMQDQLIELGETLETLETDRPFSPEEYATIKAQRAVAMQEQRSLRGQLDGDPGGLSPERRAALQERLTAVQAQIEALKRDQRLQAVHDAKMARAENEILVAETIYKDFVGQLSRRTQQDDYLQADARTIERARPDLDPSEPGRAKLAVIAGILSLIFAAFLVVLRELTQKRLRTVREIEDITGLPFIGIVPKVKIPRHRIEDFLTGTLDLNPIFMQFARKMRTGIDAAACARADPVDGGGVVIAGCSAIRGEAQTWALAALARSYVEAGLSVLVIVADPESQAWSRIRAQEHERSFDVASDLPGDLRLRIRALQGRQLHAFFLESRETDEALLRRPAELREALSSLRRSYDRIILDTAPILEAVDMVAMLKEADAQVMFLRWNHTHENVVSTAMRMIDESGITPVGVIATRVNLRKAAKFGEAAFYFKKLRPRRGRASSG